MDKKEIAFGFDETVRNTHRLQEKSVWSPAIGTLYVRRLVSGSMEPKKVAVPVA